MPDSFDTRGLSRSWTHAHEEDRDDRMVFRRSETPLPPSRGRMSFELEPSGVAHSVGPGPDDRRVRAEGSWRLEGSVLKLQLPDQAEQQFQVESVDDERLIVKRL